MGLMRFRRSSLLLVLILGSFGSLSDVQALADPYSVIRPTAMLSVDQVDVRPLGGSLKCSDSDSEFQCVNEQNCIPARWRCDGEKDCSDGSDEDPVMCSNFTCTIDQFTCFEGTSKKCLPLSWVCDGVNDCVSGADEKLCNSTCTSNEHTCKNGKCIVASWVCDGNNDCGDNSEEENCPEKTCTAGKDFLCHKDGSCILSSWRCDGESDCKGGEDEENCTSTTSPISSRCGKQEFECADRLTCIHKSWVCDSDEDCPAGDDERGDQCQHVACRSDQFQCRNLECIPGHLKCSGTPECSDHSDEEDCSPASEPAAAGSGCNRKTEFQCRSGLCIPLESVCNQKNDCGNWEDEPKDKCGVNECLVNRGGCSDLCVDTPGGYYCDCKSGFKLGENGTCEDINECEVPGTCSQTCTNEKGSFKCECLEGYLKDPKDHTRCKAIEGHASLLFALRHSIRKVSLDHLKMTLIVENTRSATALDYMFRTGMIFWTDGHDGRIYKAPIDEGDAKAVVIDSGVKSSDGLAIDWIYNHVYWTDSGKKTISVAELDGKMKKVLVSDGLVEPRSIAVNPLDGWMYWSDWGVTPGRIERAGMDGSRRETLVNTSLKWPNGLTLDLVHNRLYWVDAKMNSISSCNFDGSKRRLILHSKEALAHPFSITTFEDYLYFTDWQTETIFKANKFTGKELTAILPPNTVKSVMSVHVYHAYRQPDGENHCTPLNGRCSHLCLPAPRIENQPPISCACPEGLVLSEDEQNCSPDKAHRSHGTKVPKDAPTSRNESSNSITLELPDSSTPHDRSSAELSNEVQRIIPADSGVNQHEQNENFSRSGISAGDNGAVVIIIGILAAILVIIVVVGLLMYKNVFAKEGDGMNFDNPVYRKTTTDHHISIEKNRGFHKTYPATISEEHFGYFDAVAQEPLTSTLGVNEYV